MKLLKTTFAIGCALLCANIFAQKASETRSEKTVESEYLSSMEDIVITELAASDELDNKQVALTMLEEAASEGRITPDMSAALDQLAGEGVTSESRKNGRLMNNFPQVRAKACDILAKVPTEESKNTLTKIALADGEPMVVTAAVRSLGEIGINNNDEVINVIAFANRHNQTLTPTNSLAIEVLAAYEKLAPTVQDKKTMLDSIASIASDYHYNSVVRSRAMDLFRKLKASGSSSKN
ncbi:MAG: HEAT repeat domain-containing protein [Treponema sp.]|nr:HEAT repeat domain-containing protein [Treponema sp.]